MNTICTASDWIDIGYDHQIQIRKMNGEITGVAYKHLYPDGKQCESYLPINYDGENTCWDLINETPLTLSPSAACRACGDHGFIREGRWVKA